MHDRESVTIEGNLKLKGRQQTRLQSNDIVFGECLLALGDHSGYLRRVDLVHFAGNEQQGHWYFLIVLFIDVKWFFAELVKIRDRQVLRVLGYLLIVGENPLDRWFSILVIDGINGVGGRVSRFSETRQGSAFLQQFGRSYLVAGLELQLHSLSKF